MKILEKDGNILLYDFENFTLAETLDCGQAFRWSETEKDIWQGVAFGKYLKLGAKDGVITFYNTTMDDFNNVWQNYFDLGRNYGEIITAISVDKTLKEASSFAGGIRILRQEPWEALCSFIISQNNNIPRIKGIIDRLCQNFGEEIKEGVFSFPTAQRLAELSVEDLGILRSGFRAKYILDAAKKVAWGEVDLESLKTAELSDARAELMKIYGVGEKVADCTLLFGLCRIEAFPKDVWIKKAMEKLFGGVLPDCALPFAGIAQQYIFHYARMTKLEV
jgi:N-glycosylase/DNA lyase